MKKYLFFLISLLSLSHQTEASRVFIDPMNLQGGMTVTINGKDYQGNTKHDISLDVGSFARISIKDKNGTICLEETILSVPSKTGYKIVGKGGGCGIEKEDLMYD